jgi:hypothetical protein
MSDAGHLDLDALADVLAQAGTPAAAGHLADCEQCRAELDALRAAQTRVTSELAALPAVPIPADLAARLLDGLRAGAPGGETATVTTLPPARLRSATRWLPAAAAVVLVLAGAAYGITRIGADTGGATAASGGAEKAGAPGLDLARNDSGFDYTDRASLSAAVPDLLGGRRAAEDTAMAKTAPAPAASAQQGPGTLSLRAPDPLAALREDTGLAECLLALLPPEDPSVQPLALDYASFRGQPAMVVVLPGSVASKLDIFVVGPGCSRANDSVLFYTSVDKP